MAIPLISVIMPVHNGQQYLKEAIDSILNQTFSSFEFIIINDGSTDRSEEIILSYCDERICYVKNDNNLKIIRTLNKGIDLAQSKYIARMDADDISLPNRLSKQVQFMETNPKIDICGSWVQTIGVKKEVYKYPITHEEIKAFLLFETCFSHPATLIRYSFFNTLRYDEKYNYAEDYHLWCQAIESKIFHNLPIVLLHYRVHEDMTSTTFRTAQTYAANQVRKKMLEKIGIVASEDEIELFMDFTSKKLDLESIDKTIKWLNNILYNNEKIKYYNDNYLKKIIGEYWWQFFSQNTKFGLLSYTTFMNSRLRRLSNVKTEKYITFLIKCLIKYNRYS